LDIPAGSGIADWVVDSVDIGIAIDQQHWPIENLGARGDHRYGVREIAPRRLGAEYIRMEYEDDAPAVGFHLGSKGGAYPVDIGGVPHIEFAAVVAQIFARIIAARQNSVAIGPFVIARRINQGTVEAVEIVPDG
jgi:hypothetical protein